MLSSAISARGARVHGGAAPWRSSRAASTRRDDARCCAAPNASRAAPSRHQPAAPDAASALSSSNRPAASLRAPRGDHARIPKNCNTITEFPAKTFALIRDILRYHVAISHVIPKFTMKLPNFQHTKFHDEFANQQASKRHVAISHVIRKIKIKLSNFQHEISR